MSESNGWQALSDGNLSVAERAFLQTMATDRADSLRGLVRVRLAQGQAAEAVELAQTLLQTDPGAMSIALLGESIGATGKRREAEDWLTRAMHADPKDGWIRAVLAEQKVRRGRWDDGGNDMIAALGQSRRDEAFAHVASVFADLADAVAAGKVKGDDALKLVNRVDSSVSNKTPAMSQFFGAVRRALGSKQSMIVSDLPRAGVFASSGAPTLKENSVSLAKGPPPIRDAPESLSEYGMQGRESIEPTSNRSTGPSGPAIREAPSSLSEYGMRGRSSIEPTASGGRPLLKLMKEDRLQNENLQGSIGPIGLPAWPSDLAPLDPIESIRPQLLNYSLDILKRSDMQMTKGSVAAQILISRGVELLSSAVSGGAARPPEMNLNGLAQIEMRCLDGVLDRLPELSNAYNLEEAKVDLPTLALGSFLGVVATRLTPAVWEFQREASESVIVLGDARMHPFRAAQEWLSATDKDDAYLDYPVRRLLASSGLSAAVNARFDTTGGLTESPLRLRLAEIWMNYFPRVALSSQVDIAADIDVKQIATASIIYGIDRRWVPAVATGPRRAAMLSKTHVAVAFIRDTGEFLLLGTRQHFSRLLKYMVTSLSPEDATKCMELFVRYHRPGAKIVGEADKNPRLVEGKNGQQVLLFWAKIGGATTAYQLVFEPDGLLMWRLEFQKS
jgi:hypothetical protein